MKRLIFYFLIILGSIWVGVQIYNHPGYILLFYKDWAIETTVWFLSFAIILTFLLLYFLFNLLRGTFHLPSRIENWWHHRQEQKSLRLLTKGYSNLLLGKWRKAEKNLLKGAKNKQLSFINYAIAAQAADAQHKNEKRDEYLSLAKQSTEKESYAADIMRVRFLLKNGQSEEALTLLLNLRGEYPKDPCLLRLFAETYVQLQDWTHLQLMLPELKKNKVFDDDQYRELEKQTYLHLLKNHYFSEFSEVQTLWNKVPKYLRHDPDLLIAYASHLSRWNRANEAEELIRKELKKHFSNELMEYYVTTRSKEPAKQLALGERYLKENADDPASLRAMGMLCLRNRLWGQARDYLENSLKVQPSAETYSALGYVYEKLGENQKALAYYRKGLSYLNQF